MQVRQVELAYRNEREDTCLRIEKVLAAKDALSEAIRQSRIRVRPGDYPPSSYCGRRDFQTFSSLIYDVLHSIHWLMSRSRQHLDEMHEHPCGDTVTPQLMSMIKTQSAELYEKYRKFEFYCLPRGMTPAAVRRYAAIEEEIDVLRLWLNEHDGLRGWDDLRDQGF